MPRPPTLRGFLPLLALACAPAADGLRATPDGDGPLVLVDWNADPLPELPFPNDLATVPDATSPTGLRVNFATDAHTVFETEARHKLNELTGFGIYAPLFVRFTERLDIQAIIDRHPNDLHLPGAYLDDAFLVIDVDPDSPDYGRPVPLDVGHGRYPYDAFDPRKYFPNDTRADHPSILFDTVDEDLDGDGVLDPGEDSDNDGVLDVPNVWPPGGDPFEDLLTFYDLGTDTLIFRPVVPLREETTYAVVLTERLVGESGAPVRSPWAYVHHTRQTTALEPLRDLLGGEEIQLDLEDVAFAWTFTTGRVTGDLRDIRRGLVEGQGPWPFLRDEYPAGVEEALQVNARAGEDRYALGVDVLTDIIGPLGLVGDGAGTDVLLSWYDAFSDRLVGGSFTTPYLLADRDDDGDWDADEWWQLDPYTGAMSREPRRVAFSCILPKPREDVQPPYDVVIYGHGYGSSRFEFLLFSGAMNRFGFASCSMDFAGHGPSIGDDDLPLILQVLDNAGLKPLLQHFYDSRYRDLDNDGQRDSGGDQWTSDPFHTRDLVRQASVDWMQLVRGLRDCGRGEMALVDYDDGGAPVAAGGSRTSCDWDADGVPDMGGPDARLFLLGGSLGGMNAGVAAGVIPELEAIVPVVPGGGIVDVGVRTSIGGAVEAFVGRFVSPLVLGLPDDGGVRIVQMVNSVTNMVTLDMARVDSLPRGGSVRVTNLTKGDERVGMIHPDGRFRVSIGADALDAYEKRVAAGVPAGGPEEGVAYTLPDGVDLGDRLLIEILDADGRVVREIARFEADGLIEGVTVRAGTPLMAANDGNGEIRGAADARRLAFVTAMALEPGDPIAYAPHYFLDPFPEVGTRNVLVMPTPGDDQVPINGGIAHARAAGLVNWWGVDARYGTTVDQWLIDRQVIRGVEERGPWRSEVTGLPVLFDVDDYDEGADDYGAPSDAPLRVVVPTEAGVSGLSLPYVSPSGIHGFREPDPGLGFDINTFAINQVAAYLWSGGQEIDHRPCLEDSSCPDHPPIPGGDR